MNDEPESGKEEQIAGESERIWKKYCERFPPLTYRQVFHPPSDGQKANGLFPDAYFESAKVLLEGVVSGRFPEGVHGIAAVFLSRHYLELALKYSLYHARWLKEETTNAPDNEIESVGKDYHKLQPLWDKLHAELTRRAPSIFGTGLDLNFVREFVNEFHGVDERGMRFRYPGEQLSIAGSHNEALDIDFRALLFSLMRIYDVLSTLDRFLIEQYGANQDWENEMASW